MKLPPLGTVFDDRYELHCLMAAGGQATVYRGRDHQTGNEVAVKIGHDLDGVEREVAHRQFCIEYEVLRHPGPGLPLAHHLGSFDDRPVIIEDWIRGIGVDGLGTRVTLHQAVMVARGVLKILGHLHGRQPAVIVRDIKPENLLLGDGHVYLIDLSGARYEHADGEEPCELLEFGTAGFAAPEQYEGRSSPHSDIFSTGALLHFLLTGHEGWIRQLPCSPSEYRDDIPDELDAIVRRATAPEGTHRYASAADMEAALESIKLGVT